MLKRLETWFDRLMLNEQLAARWHTAHAVVNATAVVLNLGALIYHWAWSRQRHYAQHQRDQEAQK